MDKIIVIKQRPYKGRLPKEISDSFKYSIGGALSSEKRGEVLKGLTFNEEQVLMPALIDAPCTDTEFRKKSTEWFKKLKVSVGIHGMKLNISLEDDEKPLSENNLPKSIKDYVLWKYCLAYKRRVARTFDELGGKPEALFYLHSEVDAIEKENVKAKKISEAVRKAVELYEKPELARVVVRVIAGKYPQKCDILMPEMKGDTEMQNIITKLATEHPIEFVEVTSDKSLEKRSEIYDMINRNVIVQVGNTYTFADEPIGQNIDQIIAFISAKENGKTYLSMKAKLEGLK